MQAVGHTSLYLVSRPGPFCFTLCADGSEDKHKVLLGAQVTCSCRCECATAACSMLGACSIKYSHAADIAQLPGLPLVLWNAGSFTEGLLSVESELTACNFSY